MMASDSSSDSDFEKPKRKRVTPSRRKTRAQQPSSASEFERVELPIKKRKNSKTSKLKGEIPSNPIVVDSDEEIAFDYEASARRSTLDSPIGNRNSSSPFLNRDFASVPPSHSSTVRGPSHAFGNNASRKLTREDKFLARTKEGSSPVKREYYSSTSSASFCNEKLGSKSSSSSSQRLQLGHPQCSYKGNDKRKSLSQTSSTDSSLRRDTSNTRDAQSSGTGKLMSKQQKSSNVNAQMKDHNKHSSEKTSLICRRKSAFCHLSDHTKHSQGSSHADGSKYKTEGSIKCETISVSSSSYNSSLSSSEQAESSDPESQKRIRYSSPKTCQACIDLTEQGHTCKRSSSPAGNSAFLISAEKIKSVSQMLIKFPLTKRQATGNDASLSSQPKLPTPLPAAKSPVVVVESDSSSGSSDSSSGSSVDAQMDSRVSGSEIPTPEHHHRLPASSPEIERSPRSSAGLGPSSTRHKPGRNRLVAETNLVPAPGSEEFLLNTSPVKKIVVNDPKLGLMTPIVILENYGYLIAPRDLDVMTRPRGSGDPSHTLESKTKKSRLSLCHKFSDKSSKAREMSGGSSGVRKHKMRQDTCGEHTPSNTTSSSGSESESLISPVSRQRKPMLTRSDSESSNSSTDLDRPVTQLCDGSTPRSKVMEAIPQSLKRLSANVSGTAGTPLLWASSKNQGRSMTTLTNCDRGVQHTEGSTGKTPCSATSRVTMPIGSGISVLRTIDTDSGSQENLQDANAGWQGRMDSTMEDSSCIVKLNTSTNSMRLGANKSKGQNEKVHEISTEISSAGSVDATCRVNNIVCDAADVQAGPQVFPDNDRTGTVLPTQPGSQTKNDQNESFLSDISVSDYKDVSSFSGTDFSRLGTSFVSLFNTDTARTEPEDPSVETVPDFMEVDISDVERELDSPEIPENLVVDKSDDNVEEREVSSPDIPDELEVDKSEEEMSDSEHLDSTLLDDNDRDNEFLGPGDMWDEELEQQKVKRQTRESTRKAAGVKKIKSDNDAENEQPWESRTADLNKQADANSCKRNDHEGATPNEINKGEDAKEVGQKKESCLSSSFLDNGYSLEENDDDDVILLSDEEDLFSNLSQPQFAVVKTEPSDPDVRVKMEQEEDEYVDIEGDWEPELLTSSMEPEEEDRKGSPLGFLIDLNDYMDVVVPDDYVESRGLESGSKADTDRVKSKEDGELDESKKGLLLHVKKEEELLHIKEERDSYEDKWRHLQTFKEEETDRSAGQGLNTGASSSFVTAYDETDHGSRYDTASAQKASASETMLHGKSISLGTSMESSTAVSDKSQALPFGHCKNTTGNTASDKSARKDIFPISDIPGPSSALGVGHFEEEQLMQQGYKQVGPAHSNCVGRLQKTEDSVRIEKEVLHREQKLATELLSRSCEGRPKLGNTNSDLDSDISEDMAFKDLSCSDSEDWGVDTDTKGPEMSPGNEAAWKTIPTPAENTQSQVVKMDNQVPLTYPVTPEKKQQVPKPQVSHAPSQSSLRRPSPGKVPSVGRAIEIEPQWQSNKRRVPFHKAKTTKKKECGQDAVRAYKGHSVSDKHKNKDQKLRQHKRKNSEQSLAAQRKDSTGELRESIAARLKRLASRSKPVANAAPQGKRKSTYAKPSTIGPRSFTSRQSQLLTTILEPMPPKRDHCGKTSGATDSTRKAVTEASVTGGQEQGQGRTETETSVKHTSRADTTTTPEKKHKLPNGRKKVSFSDQLTSHQDIQNRDPNVGHHAGPSLPIGTEGMGVNGSTSVAAECMGPSSISLGQMSATDKAKLVAETKASRTMTTDDFLACVLQWNVSWLDEQAKNSAPPPVVKTEQVFPLLETYDSYDDYCEIMKPLLLLETWAAISNRNGNKSLKSRHTLSLVPSYISTVGSHRNIMELHCQGILKGLEMKQGNGLSEQDLVKLALNVGRDHGPTQIKWVFGVVETVRLEAPRYVAEKIHPTLADDPALRQPGTKVMQVILKVKARKLPIQTNQTMKVEIVDNLTPKTRQLHGLIFLCRCPLARDILRPINTEVFSTANLPSNNNCLERLNTSQRRTVMIASHCMQQPYALPKICVIQGPPGTGKSTTMVSLIKTILRTTKAENRKYHILLCAPSNAAIDVLVRKLKFERYLYKQDSRSAARGEKLTFVRMGQLQTMHEDVRPYSFHEVFKQHIAAYEKRSTNVPSSVKRALEMVKQEIDNLKTRLENARGKNMHEQERYLRTQLDEQEKKKQKLESQICKKITDKEAERLRAECLLHADVVCSTLSYSGSSVMLDTIRNYKKGMHFDCIIIDEASQCAEIECLIPLQHGCSKLILVGDSEQLPPTVLSKTAADKSYGQSLFERLYSFFKFREDNPVLLLDTQYRMHPEICRFPNQHVYHGKIKNDPSTTESRKKFGFNTYLLFNLSYGQEQEDTADAPGGIYNPDEALFVVALCEQLVQRVHRQNISIITPYQKQRQNLRQLLGKKQLGSIEVSTVDNFQGREKDVIIMSCVRAKSSSGAIGFLSDRRRMNVALTRAKYALYVVGDLKSLKINSDWGTLVDDAYKRKLVVGVSSRKETEQAVQQVVSCRS